MNWLSDLIKRFVDSYRRWYSQQISLQRHAVEEDARRLGGQVTWTSQQ